MLAEIRGRSQITIPSEIIKKLGISEGDKFDIMERDGGIFLCPVVVYPKDKIAKIAKILKESENDTKTRTAFESVEDMFSDMGIDIDNV
ncbi:AbrB/MazE/SpoVT family DNA-binding domain-containing protein [Qingrenia yutianensis]|mgnify:FL=1|uniref:AbrB/MazE/SpoVT family DNA-binding domain-containing protein n=1 Tax=Qingrenia yutianensis TaxID=2763676 RepID=A0A926F6M6_9FIRM|nr:AbrB/MazE/SpoVT family DNA-binding domain-containing protein [Qingrenia yutianensis]MBC8596763.1 AbrB/MazE/SpoVT family DNA-binding domain-containing protein [Qingrenia yutianensis]HCB95658.1 AbrB family transcriptional regulator [Ruminococcus sp.]